MKKVFLGFVALVCFSVFQSCTKNESTPGGTSETITLKSNSLSVVVGSSIEFTVNSSINNNNVTAESKIFVNGTQTTSNNHTFSQVGTFTVNATKGSLTSNVLSINVTAPVVPKDYVHNVLVEEYSGTWCGNCPRLLYGVDLLKQQTQKAFVVGIHLANSDPFISANGNSLANSRSVTSVPTAHINRTTPWTGVQYQTVSQVTNTIQASAKVGLAINSVITSGNISLTVNVGFTQTLTTNSKLMVYIVEDKLYATQANYSSTLYGGQSSIPNFEHNGVLRQITTPLTGDDIAANSTTFEKIYTFATPTNIANIANAKVVAFIMDGSGKVLNVQQAKVGVKKEFETL